MKKIVSFVIVIALVGLLGFDKQVYAASEPIDVNQNKSARFNATVKSGDIVKVDYQSGQSFSTGSITVNGVDGPASGNNRREIRSFRMNADASEILITKVAAATTTIYGVWLNDVPVFSTDPAIIVPTPTPEPTPQPTPEPTPEPTPQPTPEPTPEPTPQPTPEPTPEPTPQPTPEPTPPPIKPEQGNEQITLNWSSVDGATGYKIYRDGSLIASVGADVLTYTDTNLVNGTKYKYEIVAVLEDDEELPIGETIVSPNNGVRFDGIHGTNLLDAITTGVNWIKLYLPWVLVVSGILLIYPMWAVTKWLISLLNKPKTKGKTQTKPQTKPQPQKRTSRKLTDEEKAQRARARRILRARDDKYDLLTRLGRIEERDKWARSIDYKTREQRKRGERSSKRYKDTANTGVSRVSRSDYRRGNDVRIRGSLRNTVREVRSSDR